MRIDYKPGDKFEVTIKAISEEDKLVDLVGIDTPIPLEAFEGLKRRISDFPLEVGDTIVLDGRPDGLVTMIDNGDIHILFSDGSVGVSPAGQDLLYHPSCYTPHYILEEVKKIAKTETDREEIPAFNCP